MTIKLSSRAVKTIEHLFILAVLLWAIVPDTMLYARTLYCLQTKKQMTADLRTAIAENIDKPHYSWTLPGTIQDCWNRTAEDTTAQNQIGPLAMHAISKPEINKNLQWSCCLILRSVAPVNVYRETMDHLLANTATLDAQNKLCLLSAIFSMRTKMAIRSADKYADNDIRKVVDANRQLFDEQSPALDGLLHGLTVKYPLDYLKAKEELINLDLFELSRKYKYGNGLFDFYDPRALEDSEKYRPYLEGPQHTSSRMITSLLKHLELEFKPEWLQKLDSDELRIMRNAIYASYGYTFGNKNIQKYFYTESRMAYICRNGRCGKPVAKFTEKLINMIDRKNLALIQEMEKGRLAR